MDVCKGAELAPGFPRILRAPATDASSAAEIRLNRIALAHWLTHPDHPLPARVLVLTFDDGYRSFRDRALPVLREEHVPATLGIISSFVDHPPSDLPPVLTWDELRQLAADTLVDIESHSHDLHRYERSNPYRDTAPSVGTRRYILAEARYENREEYRSRVAADLAAAQSAFSAHFGRTAEKGLFPWERTDRAEELRKAAGLGAAKAAVGGR